LIVIDLLEEETERAEEQFRQLRVPNDERYRKVAEQFTAYFRFRSQPTPNRSAVLGEAIKQADHGRLFGPAGVTLFGQWQVARGQPERQLALYEETIPHTRGLWAFRMTLVVAEFREGRGNRAEARQSFLALASTDAGEAGDRARFALAKIALSARNGRETVQRCEQLLKAKTIEVAELLRVMGQGYELLGQPRLAAACFAGCVPTAESN
jgi:hypothetical protein